MTPCCYSEISLSRNYARIRARIPTACTVFLVLIVSMRMILFLLAWFSRRHFISIFYRTQMSMQGWKILISSRPTSPYVLVNLINNIGNSQNFCLSYSTRHSPWRVDEWIFPALSMYIVDINKQEICQLKLGMQWLSC